MVKQPVEVVCCGESLYLAGLAASLQKAGLRVISIDTSLEKAENDLKMLHPEVIIFEINQATRSFTVTLLHDYPNIRLIGFDQVHEILEVYTVTEKWVHALDDLIRVVTEG